MRQSTLKKFMQRETFATELEQHRIDCLASHGDLSQWRFLKKKARSLSREELRPPPLLNGRDLLEAGFPEGPKIGQILRSVEEQQLEGTLTRREDALRWVKKEFST